MNYKKMITDKLTARDCLVMQHLSDKDKEPRQLVDDILTAASICQIVNKLSKRNLVKRIKHPSDSRCQRLHLTPAGRRALLAHE